MKLLVVGIAWPPETFLQRKLQGLVEAGVDVNVAVSASWASLGQFKMPGVNCLIVPHWRCTALAQVCLVLRNVFQSNFYQLSSWRLIVETLKMIVWSSPRTMRRMCSRFKAFMPAGLVQPDIVHFEWVSSAIEYIPMYSIWRCPIVISCRGRQINVRPHSPNREGYLHNIERAFHQAAAVHCVSEAIRREAMQYGLDPTKAWVIRPAVDPQFFYPPSSTLRQYDCFHIVSTGSLIWRKGYEYALLAIRRLVDMGVPAEFEIIGEGPERQRILYTIDDLGLRGHVHLLGQLSPEQVRERLQQADAFLLSSLSEGISNAVLEAMSCGLPVVTTDCGGMTEVVTNGVEGFVVPVRDPDTMANCLQALWENPELRSAMGAAARERVIREFSLERQIREFLFMYQSVISKWNAQCQATSC